MNDGVEFFLHDTYYVIDAPLCVLLLGASGVLLAIAVPIAVLVALVRSRPRD